MRDSAMLKVKPCREAEGNRTNQVGLMKPDRALALPAFDKNETHHAKHKLTRRPVAAYEVVAVSACMRGHVEKWCGVTVMLRAGSNEHWCYRPSHLFNDLPPRSCLETGTAGECHAAEAATPMRSHSAWREAQYRAHICGFWRPVHCLSATAVFEKSTHSVIQGRGGGQSPLSPTESHTTVPRSAPLDDRPPSDEGRSANKERTPLPRAGWSGVTPSLASHPQVFHGGCFGVYGTPPREAFWGCEIGTKIPRVPRFWIGTFCIRRLSWLTFGWRVQTCSQVIATASQNGSSGSQPGGLAPVSIAVDAGVFRVVRGAVMATAGRIYGWSVNGVEVRIAKKKKPCCLGVASRASLRKTGLREARWALSCPARVGISLWRDSDLVPDRRA